MHLWGLTPGVLARELVANGAMTVPAIRRRRLQGLRTRAASPDFEARKILAQFEFLRHSAGAIDGRVVAEIGPGDAVGLAPLFITAGALRYVAIDRFLGDVWGPSAQALYERLERLHGPFVPDWRERVTLARHSIEIEVQDVEPVDVLLSFDVVEHLSDLPKAVRNMRGLLRPDGRMVHRVDYGPHGVWLGSPDPLAFLSVPQWLWDAMGSNRGHPNRVRHRQFTQMLREQGFKVSERITRTSGADVLDAELSCGLQAAPTLGPAYCEPVAGADRAPA